MGKVVDIDILIAKSKRAKALKALKKEFTWDIEDSDKNLKSALSNINVTSKVEPNGDLRITGANEHYEMELEAVLRKLAPFVEKGNSCILMGDEIRLKLSFNGNEVEVEEADIIVRQDAEKIAKSAIRDWLSWLISNNGHEEEDLDSKSLQELSEIVVADLKAEVVDGLEISQLLCDVTNAVKEGMGE